jgi:hypothetical protein
MPYLGLVLLLAAACTPVWPAPDDFPQPPLTPIMDFPTTLPPTPTPRPITKPIFAGDMANARTFFLMIKVGMTAGDASSIAERVLYPIEAKVHGRPLTIQSATEFEASYEGIFNSQLQDRIAGADEADVRLGLDGIQAAGGALWFNQFCADPACTQGKFLITQINN